MLSAFLFNIIRLAIVIDGPKTLSKSKHRDVSLSTYIYGATYTQVKAEAIYTFAYEKNQIYMLTNSKD